jgi:hypothetical protein
MRGLVKGAHEYDGVGLILVEPVKTFLGTVRLDGLNYQNVELEQFYPHGDVGFPWWAC